MSTAPREPSTVGEPAWEIARMFPAQGSWSEADYFGLESNRRIEFDRGVLDFLPMPTLLHQLILQFFYEALKAHLAARNVEGLVLVAGYKVRLEPGKFREPDVLVILDADDPRVGPDFTDRADLVVEVVSESNRDHDWTTKRAEYARAGIPEYWVVDPEARRVAVLRLDGDAYAEHGAFAPGDRATSALLPGFAVDAAAALDPPRR
jgi:Uma2 family endonuclease